MSATYLFLEVKRLIRNGRFLIFSCVFPVILFFIESGLYGKDAMVPGRSITYGKYLMCSLAAWGALNATMNAGVRISIERSIGWQRQLRLTPLRPWAYLLAKVTVGMAIALPPTLFMSVAGLASGVHLSVGGWTQIALGVWIATLPFAVLGVLLGQVADTKSIQVLLSFGLLILGFVGGLLIPATKFPAWLLDIAKALPSYWLAEVGHSVFTGNTNLLTTVLNLTGWTITLSIAVSLRYRRDSART
jgi:ABC-2 type transport system permease protein